MHEDGREKSISGAEPPFLGCFGARDHGVAAESDHFSSFALGLKYLMWFYCETFGRVILSSTFLFFARYSISNPAERPVRSH